MPPERLSLDDFGRLVQQRFRNIVRSLPADLRRRLKNLVVDVEHWPSRRLLRDLGLAHEQRSQLFGVFLGRGTTDQEFGERPMNRIIIFQRPLELVCASRAELEYETQRTLLHELAHHFGFREQDLDTFEQLPSPFDTPPTDVP